MMTRHSVSRLLFWAAFAFAVLMALLPHPPNVIEAGDKFQHSVAFVTLTILGCAGYPRAGLLRIGERLSFLGAMIELVQSIPSLHRQCDIMDWVADTSVVVGVLAVIAIVERGRRSRGAASGAI
jgi:hypothetical protein